MILHSDYAQISPLATISETVVFQPFHYHYHYCRHLGHLTLPESLHERPWTSIFSNKLPLCRPGITIALANFTPTLRLCKERQIPETGLFH